MPSYQYLRSFVAQFPEDVSKNAGASDVPPLVIKSLDADKVLAVQFLRAGRVRLTFQDSETCSQVLKEGLHLSEFPLICFLLMIDCVPSIFETFRSRLRTNSKLPPVSLLALERFCPLAILSSMIIPVFLMVIVWLEWYWTATFHSLLKWTDVTAVSGNHANHLNVQFAVSLVIVPKSAHSLVAAGVVTSLAIWPENVHRLGAHPFPFHVLIIRWRSKTPIPVPPLLMMFLVLLPPLLLPLLPVLP